MIIIRRIRFEDSLAPLTQTVDLRLGFRNPSRAMHPANVNHHVVLHGAGTGTTRTGPLGPRFLSMHLHHVLLQAALLDERLVTSGLLTWIIEGARVPLHMIKHGVLTFLCFSAIRTNKETFVIFQILGHRTGHLEGIATHQVF